MRARIRSSTKRTVIWYGVDPFVQSRVEFCDNVLLPLLADKAKQRL